MIEELKPYIKDIVIELFPEGKEKNINGHKEYNCLCPFHDDHEPSMFVNIEEGVYHCFACNAKGDIIHLYAEINGITDKEALSELKSKYLGQTINIEKRQQSENTYDIFKKAQYMETYPQSCVCLILPNPPVIFNSPQIWSQTSD